MLTAAELYDRGVAASAAGQFAQARRALGQALRRTEDPDLLALIRTSLAYALAETGNPQEALALCAQALQEAVTARTRGVVISQRGLLLARRGEAAAAERDLAEAIELLADDDELNARARTNRGMLLLQRGVARRAREDFAQARLLFERAGNPVNSAKAGYNLGYSDLLLGDIVAALRTMDEVGPGLAELGPVYGAMYQQDRAEVLIAAGLVQEGQAALREAAGAYGTRRLAQFQAEAELLRARLLLRSDPAEAARTARRAARRFRSRDSQAWAVRADAVEVMARVGRGGRGPALVERADQLLAALREHGQHGDAQLLSVYAARVQVRRRELGDAGTRLRQTRLNAATPIGTRLLHREVRADLARARGHRARSFAEIRAGLAELHAWQASFGSLDLQSNLVGHGRQLAVDGLQMAVADGSPALVLEWSERARALVSNLTPVRPPANEQVAAELAELRMLQRQSPDPRSEEGRRAARLRADIRQHAWFGNARAQVLEPVELADLQAGLVDPAAALIAYLHDRGRLIALVVTADRATVRPIGRLAPVAALLAGLHADLQMVAARLSERLRTAVVAGLARRLAELADLLVSPVADLIGDRRVVLTPSGVLAPVPWTLLPGLVGRPLTVPQSATRWLAAGSAPAHRPGETRVGFVAGPRVPRAEDEVHRCSTRWPGAKVLTGARAAADAVTGLAGEVELLHVSAHGRHATDNPMFSALELDDGDWSGYDIDHLAGIPPTVVLSACELGRASVRAGEEMVGMTAAWLHAGSTSVLAATAAMGDDVACDLLGRTHARLAAGRPPAEALAEAAPSDWVASQPAPLLCFGRGW